jgi:hypothetical protein
MYRLRGLRQAQEAGSVVASVLRHLSLQLPAQSGSYHHSHCFIHFLSALDHQGDAHASDAHVACHSALCALVATLPPHLADAASGLIYDAYHARCGTQDLTSESQPRRHMVTSGTAALHTRLCAPDVQQGMMHHLQLPLQAILGEDGSKWQLDKLQVCARQQQAPLHGALSDVPIAEEQAAAELDAAALKESWVLQAGPGYHEKFLHPEVLPCPDSLLPSCMCVLLQGGIQAVWFTPKSDQRRRHLLGRMQTLCFCV